MSRLRREDALLVVIDVQEKLMPVIDGHELVEKNIDRLVRGFHLLSIPALLTEQYVKGLGGSVAGVRKTFEETVGYSPIEKACFSAYGCGDFRSALEKTGRHHAVVAGVESHVCVYQTVTDLIEGGFDVTLIADATSSRSAANKEIAVRRMTAGGAHLSSTEMALFELLVSSGTDEFRAISKLVK